MFASMVALIDIMLIIFIIITRINVNIAMIKIIIIDCSSDHT